VILQPTTKIADLIGSNGIFDPPIFIALKYRLFVVESQTPAGAHGLIYINVRVALRREYSVVVEFSLKCYLHQCWKAFCRRYLFLLAY
jgi:hypothetical protein